MVYLYILAGALFWGYIGYQLTKLVNQIFPKDERFIQR